MWPQQVYTISMRCLWFVGKWITSMPFKKKKTLTLTCKLLRHSIFMFGGFHISNGESGSGISSYHWAAQRQLLLTCM